LLHEVKAHRICHGQVLIRVAAQQDSCAFLFGGPTEAILSGAMASIIARNWSARVRS